MEDILIKPQTPTPEPEEAYPEDLYMDTNLDSDLPERPPPAPLPIITTEQQDSSPGGGGGYIPAQTTRKKKILPPVSPKMKGTTSGKLHLTFHIFSCLFASFCTLLQI